MKIEFTRRALRSFLVAVGGLILAANPLFGEPESPVDFEVRVAGLRVVGDGYGGGEDRILPLGWRRGTTVSLMVTSTAGSVLDIDPAASKLAVFEDDKGTDLRPAPGSARPPFGLYPQRSKDRQAALVEIWSDGRAAPDARELRAKGTLELKFAGEKREEATGAIAPRAGAAAVLGGRTVSVLAGLPFPDELEEKNGEKVSPEEADETGDEGDPKGEKGEAGKNPDDEPGDDGTEIADEKEGVLSLRIDGEPEGIANLKIYAAESLEPADGRAAEPLEMSLLGVRVIHRGGVRTIHRFELPDGFAGDIVIRADVWTAPKTVQVPFDAKVSVGLGGG